MGPDGTERELEIGQGDDQRGARFAHCGAVVGVICIRADRDLPLIGPPQPEQLCNTPPLDLPAALHFPLPLALTPTLCPVLLPSMALEQLSLNMVFDGQLFKYKFKVRITPYDVVSTLITKTR